METLQREILGDLLGYGRLVAYYSGQRLVEEGEDASGTRPLSPQLAECFVHGLYAEILARARPHLYRYFDALPGEDPEELRQRPTTVGGLAMRRGAALEGGWWSTRLPGIAHEDRRLLALSHEWNRMDLVVDAALAEGARVYVGRAAAQSDAFRGRWGRLTGGAIQFYVPVSQANRLARNRVLRVR